MKTRHSITWGVATAAIALLVGAAPTASDWPQFRGAQRNGVADGAGLDGWPEGGPKVAWKRPIGQSFSQLVVRENAVFTGTSDDSQDYLVRLDGTSGEEVWRLAVGDLFVNQFGNGPRSSPTLDGEMVYFSNTAGKLFAVKAADGGLTWSVDLQERFGVETPRFGYSWAPLVLDDLVLISVGAAEDKALAALDKKTGQTRWTALSGPVGYGSPVVAELGGQLQILLVQGKMLTALDAKGQVVWSHELAEGAIATPLLVGDGRIFIATSGDAGCVMLAVKNGDDGFAVEELWKNRNMRNHFNSTVLHGEFIYGFDNATLRCLSVETGEVQWVKRGWGKGSLIAAGDSLFVLSDKGKLIQIDATPEGYHELGAIQALEQGRSWTSPSMAAGRLYLRNLTEMTCLDMRG